MRRTPAALLGTGLLGAVLLALPASAEEEERSSFSPKGEVRALEVDVDSGDVTVRRGSRTTVDVVSRWELEEPTVSVEVEDGVLRVVTRCDQPGLPGVTIGGLGTDCETDVVVTLAPAKVDADVSTGRGDLSLTALDGRHALATGSGAIGVARTTGASLRVESSSGDVVVRDARTGQLQVGTGSGDVAVQRVTATTRAVVDTSSGAVRLERLTSPDLRFASGSGTISGSVLRTSTLRGATSSGDVHVSDLRTRDARLETGSGDLVLQELAATGDVSASTSSGLLRATDLSGADIALENGSGDIGVSRVRAALLKAVTSSGDVAVTGARVAEHDLSTGSGDVVVVASAAPARVAAETSAGDVTVTVPAGRYALRASTSSGNVVVDGITPDRSAVRVLQLATGSGDITVIGR